MNPSLNKGNILPVRIYGDICLKKVSSPVKEIDTEVKQLIADLIRTMYKKDGVGLAAPQVGENLRIFVVDAQWFESNEEKPLVFINPKFISMTGVETSEEGCLSLPEITADVVRAEKVIIEAINEKGELVRHQAEGIFARAIQHEYDHLDGILFIERISKIKRLSLRSKLKRLEQFTDEDGVNTDEILRDES